MTILVRSRVALRVIMRRALAAMKQRLTPRAILNGARLTVAVIGVGILLVIGKAFEVLEELVRSVFALIGMLLLLAVIAGALYIPAHFIIKYW